jgi:hypothetical protein
VEKDIDSRAIHADACISVCMAINGKLGQGITMTREACKMVCFDALEKNK